MIGLRGHQVDLIGRRYGQALIGISTRTGAGAHAGAVGKGLWGLAAAHLGARGHGEEAGLGSRDASVTIAKTAGALNLA